MTADDLNALVAQAYDAAFSYEPELESVYRRAFDRASRHAATRFRETAVTAAGFVPPPYDTLATGLTEKEQEQADRVRDKAAKAVAAALVALGLTAVAASFLESISQRGSLNFEQELLRTLRTIVAKGLAEGWTADATALAIQEAFTNVSSTTAQMLAQCLPPETVVDAAVVRAVTRRWHEGSMAVLVTDSGRKFTATPNHPMLTRRGWVSAGELQEGDDLICGIGQQQSGDAGDEDVAHVPATIAEIFESALAVGIGERRPGRQPDFHGDGEESEVDIAWPDRELHIGTFAALDQHVCQLLFTETDLGRTKFCLSCSRLLSIDEQHCLCGVSQGYPVIRQDSANGSLANPEAVTDLLRGVEGFVETNDLQLVKVGSEHRGSSTALEELSPCTTAVTHYPGLPDRSQDFPGNDSEFIGNPLDRKPVEIQTDSVISVEIIPYVGHVYNLTTPYGYFTANGYYTGNTELTSLVNQQALEAAQKVAGETSAPLYKRWRTVGDNRVRVAHAHTEGQTVPVDQPFNVAGFALMYPGDLAGPARLVIRCRCRLEFSNSLTASAQEDTLMTMQTDANSATSATDATIVYTRFSDNTLVPTVTTAGLTVTIEETEDDEMESEGMACPECGAMNDGEAQVCDQCGAAMSEAESPAEDTGEGGVEEDMTPEWTALLAIEGQPTEDGRLIDPGALSWRDLPLSLMAMDTTGPGGHEGAQVAGRIDRIWRDGSDIYGSGVFDTGEFGCKVKRMVAEQTLRGNSVDLAVTAFEYRNEAGDVLDMDGVMEAMMADEPVVMAVTEGVIMASTVCPTPAIAGAEIMLASGVMRMSFFFAAPEETLTASAAGMAPLHPPAAWFDDPKLDRPTPLTVTKEGKVYGHAALWNSCHIGEPSGPGVCVPPPRSGMNYEIFHHGAVETAEGHDVPCGQITMSTLHAGRDLGWKATLEHYEHSGCAVADVQAHEDRFGIVVAGALRPELPAAKVRELKAGSLSGDWRQVIGRGLEFLAALVVNIAGFPIPRPEARIAASAAGEEEVLALVAAGIVTVEDEQQMSRREYLRKIGVLTS